MLIAKIKDLFFNRRNKVEIEEISGENIDLSETNLIVKTLEQIEPNMTLDFEFNQPSNTYLSVTDVYSRFEVFNNICYLVLNFKIKNNGEDSSSSFNYTIANVTVPESLGEKIYDFGGKKVSEAPTLYESTVTTVDGFHSASSYPDVVNQRGYIILQHDAINKLAILYYTIPLIEPGKTIKVTARLALTLR